MGKDPSEPGPGGHPWVRTAGAYGAGTAGLRAVAGVWAGSRAGRRGLSRYRPLSAGPRDTASDLRLCGAPRTR
ncbi:hypothetical protein Stsp01_38890 [Streptomyces sp. NBRC 13847]|nr:hypothetical protein Stsp01_38890 [Streptomyces sp. NBRC 13847]